MRWIPAVALALLPSTAWALQVRTDRPRILLSDGNGPGTTLQQYKQRCTSDPVYQSRCQNALDSTEGLWAAIGPAAAWLVNGEAARCTTAHSMALSAAQDEPGQPDAHSFISNNGRTMAQLAVVRDWCDGALDAQQKQSLETRIALYADWYVANSPGDVFHDDMANAWNAVALAGLTLKGTGQDAKADEYLQKADAQWKNIILPAMAHEGDWWHEGFVYAQPTLGALAWYALAWTTATDDNVYQWAETHAANLFEGYLQFHAYAWRPDNRYVYFGDTSDNKQSIELFSRWLVDALTLGTGSKTGQALSLELKQKSQPGYDYAGANGYMIPVWYDASKDALATPRATLPKARWLSQGAADIAILRSGWGDDDTFVYIACGDYFGAHQRYESGSFQVFRKAPLTGSTGYYDAFDTDHWQNYYSQHAVHANTLAIYQPGEFFPTIQSLGDKSKNVNDGGQRVLRRNDKGTGFPSPDLATYLKNKTSGTMYETGDLVAFDPAGCSASGQPLLDYVACDVTAAYSSPNFVTNGNTPKVSEVTRQFVFVHPDTLVVFDRVQTMDPSYDKRFLLHAQGAQQVDGSTVTLTNGAGRLISRTLLPAAAELNPVADFAVDGIPHPPNQTGLESGGARVEVSPKQEGARDYFLHVMRATDATDTSAPVASATDDANTVTLNLSHAGSEVTLVFSKSGAMGAHVSYEQNGTMLCDRDLATSTAPDAGAGGSGGSGAAGSGGSSATGSGGAAGADAGAGAAAGNGPAAWPAGDDDSGCGCRAGTPARSLSGAAAITLALLALRRRAPRPKTRRSV